LWNWISIYNGFIFQGSVLEDLWIIDSCIPLKDKLLIELIRSAVIWVLWLERNEIIFKFKKPTQVRLDMRILVHPKMMIFHLRGRGASFAGRNAFRGGCTIRGRGASYDTQSNVWKRSNSSF
jgi:hypothetical protein